MRITPVINRGYKPVFKSSCKDDYQEDGVWGYHPDGSSTLEMRDKRQIPPARRLSEFELTKLLESLQKQPLVINDEKLQNIGIKSFRKIGKNSYAGATLEGRRNKLESLKEAGVERVIDLIGYQGYESDCESCGLEYTKFDLGILWWKNAAFCNKTIWLENKVQDLRLLMKEGKVREFIDNSDSHYDKEKREFIESFVNFIMAMRKGNLYIGCEHGTAKTNNALKLNYIFNPKYENFYSVGGFSLSQSLVNLYDNFTVEDKKNMRYTPEFEEKIKARLKIKTAP
jgi:hypothetical protein